MTKNYRSQLLRSWSETIPLVNKSSPSKHVRTSTPSAAEKVREENLRKKHNYNAYASKKTPLRRSLPDLRIPECQRLSYPEELPTTSVIIIFHNEIWSTLLRTVWSVVDRSPHNLIEEIILVDDVSTWDVLKRPLDDYIKLLPAPVKIIRTEKREGLIRARLIGAKHAKVT